MADSAVMTFAVFCDFDFAGSGTPDFTTPGDDLTAFVINIPSVTLGINSPMEFVAFVGQCEITLNNETKAFSPAYTSAAYYSKLVPNKPVKVTITDGATTW